MAEELVILIVKAANQSFVDQRIECSLDWTALTLKEEICSTHPAKPPVQEQRLIYSGQLLQDSVSLRAALRHPSDNNEFIIHLVCSSPKGTASTKWTQSQTLPPRSQTASAPVLTNETPSLEASATTPSGGARQRVITPVEHSPSSPDLGAQQPELDTSSPYSYLSQYHFPVPPTADPMQQMLTMQQIYSQYMMSYMQYMQSGGVQSSWLPQEAALADAATNVATSTPLPQVATTSTSHEVGDPPPNPAPQPQPPANANEEEAQQNQPPLRANPQAGAVGDDEEEGLARDWLDYIYFGSRMVVLLSIVYFYSNIVRFMVVACATFLIYLYQCGCLRFWRADEPPQEGGDPQAPLPEQGAEGGVVEGAEEEERNGNAPPHSSQAAASSRDAETSEETEGENAAAASPDSQDERETSLRRRARAEVEEGAEDVQPSADESQHQPPSPTPTTQRNPPVMEDSPPPHPPSLLALSWTFLTTFFTSLIPEQHQIV